jgi:hypothetical protein
MTQSAGLRRLDRQHGREGGVAVVSSASPVQAISLENRLPRAEVFAPPGHFRLLVEMSVEQHCVVRRRGTEGWDLHEDDGCAAGQLVHLNGEPDDRPRSTPVTNQFDGTGHVAVLTPLRVVQHRHVRMAMYSCTSVQTRSTWATKDSVEVLLIAVLRISRSWFLGLAIIVRTSSAGINESIADAPPQPHELPAARPRRRRGS